MSVNVIVQMKVKSSIFLIVDDTVDCSLSRSSMDLFDYDPIYHSYAKVVKRLLRTFVSHFGSFEDFLFEYFVHIKSNLVHRFLVPLAYL